MLPKHAIYCHNKKRPSILHLRTIAFLCRIFSCTLIIFVLSCSYSHANNSPKEKNISTNNPLLLNEIFTSVLQQQKDSIYTELRIKINSDSTYVPVIRYITDNIVPEYYRKDYNTVSDEPFFNEPLRYLTKTAVNDKTLITAEFITTKQLFYFLMNKEHRITDCIEFTSYRESIGQRQIYDWNKDGEQEIVELRNYDGQLFTTTTEVVYSVTDNLFKRIFSLETHETNCVTTDEQNHGRILWRTYQQIEPGIFRISETEGKCDCETDIPDEMKYFPATGRKEYNMTTQELLKNFGKQYNR